MATDKLVDFDHVTDYISREAAGNGIYSCPTKTDADGYIWVRTKDVAHMIDEIPAADVRLADNHWLTWEEMFPDQKPRRKNNLGVFCSACKKHADNITDFCPNCGADMRGGEY